MEIVIWSIELFLLGITLHLLRLRMKQQLQNVVGSVFALFVLIVGYQRSFGDHHAIRDFQVISGLLLIPIVLLMLGSLYLSKQGQEAQENIRSKSAMALYVSAAIVSIVLVTCGDLVSGLIRNW